MNCGDEIVPPEFDPVEVHLPGEQLFYTSFHVAPGRSVRLNVAFEDNGETGYFYAMDPSLVGQLILSANDVELPSGKQPFILDALQIYDVASVVDRSKPLSIQITKSKDGLKAGLLVNGQYHAVFDFEARRGWCLTGLPPSNGEWSKEGHDWDEQVVNFFD